MSAVEFPSYEYTKKGDINIFFQVSILLKIDTQGYMLPKPFLGLNLDLLNQTFWGPGIGICFFNNSFDIVNISSHEDLELQLFRVHLFTFTCIWYPLKNQEKSK